MTSPSTHAEFFGAGASAQCGGPQLALREAARLTSVAVWTAIGWLAWNAATSLMWFAPRVREQTRRAVVRRWARGVARALRLRIVVHGATPPAPFLLVTNHLSYLDVIVLAAHLDGRFVAKEEVRTWPVFGALAAMIGTLFVPRRVSRGIAVARDAVSHTLRGGEGVILFAEGTSSDGSRVLPLRAALLDGAAREQVPVHVAALRYRSPAGDPPARSALCWWGDMSFLPHLRGVARLKHAEVAVRFATTPLVATDRRLLASEVHRSLSDTLSALPEGFTP